MDDLISRQAAIDVASGYCHPANIADELRKLPSAEPERKTGRWECVEYGNGLYNYHCTRCRNIPRGNVLSNFCPNCGADMRGEEDETN